MNKINTLKILIFFFLITTLFSSVIFAEDLDSNNLKIKDFTFSTTGENSVDGTNLKSLISGDEILNDVRFSSNNYTLGTGVTNTWKANVPKVKCFETISSGSSACDNPAVTAGMVEVCGQGGCFNKARFEIDPQDNPSDTLYSVRISTDPSWSTWQYIDGSTFLIENAASHDINDYLTESSWETPTFNILGLNPNTTYYLKLTALHGDFTETEPSTDANTTTSYPMITFDIDIANTSGAAVETGGPYAVDLGTITYPNVSTAANLIWMDVGTNMTQGVQVFGESLNGGLFSASSSNTIPSIDVDLDSAKGFGIQEYSTTQTYLGPLQATSSFSQSGNIVGGISDVFPGTEILNSSSSPVYEGRISYYVKAKADETTISAGDYTDTLTFLVAGSI